METVLQPGLLMGSRYPEGFLLLEACSALLLAVPTFPTLFSHGSGSACSLLSSFSLLPLTLCFSFGLFTLVCSLLPTAKDSTF